MDKKSLLGIAVIAVLFLGFAYFSGKEQEQYQKELAAYEAYQDSLAAAARAEQPVGQVVADSLATVDTLALRERQVARLGEYLAAARQGEERIITLENDVMTVRFSTRGGQVAGVTLKDYTRYAPRGERNELVELFDPSTASFDLSFYVRNGLNNVEVNTMDYLFEAQPVVRTDDGAQLLTMRLAVAADAWLQYEYRIYDVQTPERDYLVDFDVRLVNMAPQMANQTSIGITWSNSSYQNEKGFKNENMYTTLSYRFPGESSIEDLGMSEKDKSKKVSTAVNWVAFKQQYFSSVFIAPENLSYAEMSFDTAEEGSELLKDFSLQTAVPYTPQTEGYDFSFYFGPNKYAILKKVADAEGEVFEFNVFSATLGYSRLHRFVYSRTRTEDDVMACLLAVMAANGGTARTLVTDNMSSIVSSSASAITFLRR